MRTTERLVSELREALKLKLTFHVQHAADITIRSKTDGSGQYPTLADAKRAARSSVDYSNWNKQSKSEARQLISAMTLADFEGKETTRTIPGY